MTYQTLKRLRLLWLLLLIPLWACFGAILISCGMIMWEYIGIFPPETPDEWLVTGVVPLGMMVVIFFVCCVTKIIWYEATDNS